jgi:hypothetical protein
MMEAQIIIPPPRGTDVSRSLWRELKTSAFSPVIVFSLAVFFQKWNLFKNLITIGASKKENTPARVDTIKSRIISKVKNVI